jgi:hypothetical protein
MTEGARDKGQGTTVGHALRAGDDLIVSPDALELFFGEATDAEARVYARLPWDGPLDGWRLTGTLTGPECRFAKTLPAKFDFHDLGPGQGLLAEAIVTEPCFWTPDLPFLYRCTVELRMTGAGGAAEAPVYSSRSAVMSPHVEHGIHSAASSRRSVRSTLVERWFGIRRLGAIGRSLYLDGKRWVARGVCRDQADISDLAAAREASAVLRVGPPDNALCLEASHLGVPLLVNLDGDNRQLAAEIRRLGQWPAVFAIILDPAAAISTEHRAAARNALFAVTWPRLSETRGASLGETRPRVDWAQLAICPTDSTETFTEAVRDCPIPAIAVRQIAATASIPQARSACDRLQFDMAPVGQFAGYLV